MHLIAWRSPLASMTATVAAEDEIQPGPARGRADGVGQQTEIGSRGSSVQDHRNQIADVRHGLSAAATGSISRSRPSWHGFPAKPVKSNPRAEVALMTG